MSTAMQIARERRGLALGRALGVTDALRVELELAEGCEPDMGRVLDLHRLLGDALERLGEAAQRVRDAEGR